MQFWVYILRCSDGSYYAGHSDSLEARLWQHQRGVCCDWTARRRPVELVWYAQAPTREEALAFERRIKRWTRAKKEALIAGDWNEVRRLARPPHERPVHRKGGPAGGEVERRLAQGFEQRPSTSLRTNEVEDRSRKLIHPRRSAKRVVEGRMRYP